MSVLVNAMGMRCLANYLTERAFPVSPPKLGDRSTSLGFNYERCHDRVGTLTCRPPQVEGFLSGANPDHRAVVVATFENLRNGETQTHNKHTTVDPIGLDRCMPTVYRKKPSTLFTIVRVHDELEMP